MSDNHGLHHVGEPMDAAPEVSRQPASLHGVHSLLAGPADFGMRAVAAAASPA
ncbi:hypothetical protein [Streptomyces sp. NPDC048411]|uniref:hypothetical protein n=1 Tax=Streptomyces sp. NPDC048411 TaxID=3157206 RepID=UPI0034542086